MEKIILRDIVLLEKVLIEEIDISDLRKERIDHELTSNKNKRSYLDNDILALTKELERIRLIENILSRK